jgi:hypothetical protein
MGYEAALDKSWKALAQDNQTGVYTVKFLGDDYNIDLKDKRVVSCASDLAVKDFTAILILHYLAKKITGLAKLTRQWVSFKELSKVEGYGEAFRKRALEPIIQKYGTDPENLFTALRRLPGEKARTADASVIVEAFEGVPVLIELWAGDEEFGPEVNMLFDKSITDIFCTEDTVVLAGLIAWAL